MWRMRLSGFTKILTIDSLATFTPCVLESVFFECPNKFPKDDHLLELAVASGTKLIVTHNTKDFKGIGKFGIRALTPKELMEEII